MSLPTEPSSRGQDILSFNVIILIENICITELNPYNITPPPPQKPKILREEALLSLTKPQGFCKYM